MENYLKPKRWYDPDFSDHQIANEPRTSSQQLVTGHSLGREDLDGKLIKTIRPYDKTAREYD